MHNINDVIVHGGQIVLSHLPFSDGQHVRVVVTEMGDFPVKLPVAQVRELLHGAVRWFDYSTEPMIPEQAWEMCQ